VVNISPVGWVESNETTYVSVFSEKEYKVRHAQYFMREQDVFGKLAHRDNEQKPLPFGDAAADATARLCFGLHAKAIVSITSGGMSVVTFSSARPAAPLIAGHTHPNKLARHHAIETKPANEGDNVIVVRGFHHDSQLSWPTITILTL
jgi:pyruvate kinase